LIHSNNVTEPKQISKCDQCSSTSSECARFVKVIASIEDPAVIQKVLTHLDDNAISAATALLPDCRASPPAALFD
jgi:hypothetical protein